MSDPQMPIIIKAIHTDTAQKVTRFEPGFPITEKDDN